MVGDVAPDAPLDAAAESFETMDPEVESGATLEGEDEGEGAEEEDGAIEAVADDSMEIPEESLAADEEADADSAADDAEDQPEDVVESADEDAIESDDESER